MEYLRIGSRLVEYELRKSNKAQRLIITIRDQKMKVSVPAFVTFAYAKNYIENHKEQILKQLEKIEAKSGNASVKQYSSGEKHLYRGRYYPLNIEDSIDASTFAVFMGSRITVYVPSGLRQQERSDATRKLLEEWYIRQAKKLLPEQVDYYAKRFNISYEKIRVKNQKSKWGSCSSKGGINLNWHIIMAPNQVIAYVIIHELAHLKHMNHSGAFWGTVEEYFPEYKQWRKWLRDNGRELMG